MQPMVLCSPGSSPLPEAGEMLLDSVAGSWELPPQILSVLCLPLKCPQPLAADQPFQTAPAFPVPLRPHWSLPPAALDTSGCVRGVAQDARLIYFQRLDIIISKDFFNQNDSMIYFYYSKKLVKRSQAYGIAMLTSPNSWQQLQGSCPVTEVKHFLCLLLNMQLMQTERAKCDIQVLLKKPGTRLP